MDNQSKLLKSNVSGPQRLPAIHYWALAQSSLRKAVVDHASAKSLPVGALQLLNVTCQTISRRRRGCIRMLAIPSRGQFIWDRKWRKIVMHWCTYLEWPSECACSHDPWVYLSFMQKCNSTLDGSKNSRKGKWGRACYKTNETLHPSHLRSRNASWGGQEVEK